MPSCSPLDFTIKQRAINSHNTLQNGKEKGLDGIMNEIIKNSREIITPLLLTIFNCILSQSIYPKCWTISFLKPILKSTNLLDPSNHGGIAVMSCLAELLNNILSNRLDKLFETNIIKKE